VEPRTTILVILAFLEDSLSTLSNHLSWRKVGLKMQRACSFQKNNALTMQKDKPQTVSITIEDKSSCKNTNQQTL
jgi:hypothetical protein